MAEWRASKQRAAASTAMTTKEKEIRKFFSSDADMEPRRAIDC